MHFISLRGKGREGSAMLLSTNWPLNCYRLVLFSFCFREGRGAKRNTLYTNVIGISKAATSVIFETAKVDLNYITRFLFQNYFDVLNIYDVNDVLAVFTPHTFVYFSALGTRHLGHEKGHSATVLVPTWADTCWLTSSVLRHICWSFFLTYLLWRHKLNNEESQGPTTLQSNLNLYHGFLCSCYFLFRNESVCLFTGM